MKLASFEKKIPKKVFSVLKDRGFEELRPSQTKSIDAGLFEDKNLLVCTPTASGKTLVAELAILNAVFHDKGKAVYVVPLRALASEKFKDFKKLYDKHMKIAISSGDIDSADSYLEKYDVIITTSEKLDSLIRHRTHWLSQVKVLIVDEIHLLNDASRGPTLEIIITMAKKILPKLQLIGLSATIGNPKELADWLDAELVVDSWRPVRLDKGVYLNGEIKFV
ncbi:MAG: DEAD/DEAH box helicase [Nanoarchaeota archaeon]|nr:DEAD/DEAH box helicase [Nanoarchaeota archaeon]MBU1269842.1 DEAD/DEAH box helicase [Nanoarchaeota archaeon]MBU1605150.1 DEAD/DEAH box helicase [Nanoarchaeota archaeon]MBU2442965.1 DEAD/DEAH box helicase [Nanoarchaeota archaeon]